LAIAVAAPAAAQTVAPAQRVMVTADAAPAYSCAATTCRVIAELDKGAIVSVVKTDGDWHQVMVRLATSSVTTGWVKASQVTVTTTTTAGEASSGERAVLVDRDPGDDGDPRGCLTCLATRTPTREEWSAALAEAATKKAPAPSAATVAPGLADGRTPDEKMRDAFAQRYDPELKRLAEAARAVDGDLSSYLSYCYERFGSIPVAGAAPRSTNADEILRQARSSPGAARFALWNGTAQFAWNQTWAPPRNDDSSLPSCERMWEDARGRADRVKVDVEFLERDAVGAGIYPGVVREMLAARNLAEAVTPPPAVPVTDVR
jgi:uncharacterized protein YgiM (DUF1202 family)